MKAIALLKILLFSLLLFTGKSLKAADCFLLPGYPQNDVDGYVRLTWGVPPGAGIAPEFSQFTTDIAANPVPPIPAARYATWCFDATTTINPGGPNYYSIPGTWYGGYLYSSYDPNLNSFLPDRPGVKQPQENWNKINWLINNRSLACNGVVPTMWEVQNAIYLIFGQTPPTPGGIPAPRAAVVQCLVNAANLHGDFTPSCGDKVAVIFNIDFNWDTVPGNEVQLLFLEYKWCPTVICPADVELNCEDVAQNPGLLDPNVNSALGKPHAGDCCPVNATYVDSSAQGSCPNETIITRTWTAKTACSTNTCVQTITIKDNSKPVISGVPADIEVECDAIPDPAVVTAEDACEGTVSVDYNQEIIPGSCPSSYSIVRTWTAKDSCGNTEVATQTITVIDTTAPKITSITLGKNLGCNPTSIPETVDVSGMDNCTPSGDLTFAMPYQDEVDGCTVRRTFTVTAKDLCGNVSAEATVVFYWTIDTEAPKITEISSGADLGCNPTTIPETVMVKGTDNCALPEAIAYDISYADTQAGCVKTRTFSVFAKDSCGNVAEAKVVYTWSEDTTKPEFTSVPTGADLGCNPPSVPTTLTVAAQDNCTPASGVAIDISYADTGDCAKTRTFTIKAKDACGNIAETTVVYTWTEDTTKPVITSVSEGGDLGCNPATIPTSVVAAAEDNCTPVGSLILDISYSDTGDCAKTRTFTITAKDACGNISEAKTVVFTWTQDTTPPVITCPPDVNIPNAGLVFCSFTPGGWGAPPNGGNVGMTLLNGFAQVFPAGFVEIGIPGPAGFSMRFNSPKAIEDYLPAGSTAGALTADLVDPITSPAGVFGGHVLALTLNVKFSAAGLIGGPVPMGSLVLNDAASPLNGLTVDQILALANTALGGGALPAGVDIGMLKDFADNVNNAFGGCAPNAWATSSLLPSGGASDPGVATATDNCDPAPVITFYDKAGTGDCYQIIRTWVATDACGNTSICEQKINVVDEVPPVLTVPGNLALECGSPVPAPGTATATDNRDSNPVVVYLGEVESGDACDRLITRKWKATDSCGNSVTNVQLIAIKDTTAPLIGSAGPSKTIGCDEAPVFTPPTATDCTPNPTIVVVNDVTVQNPGGGYTRTVTWKAVDACGNSSGTVSQSITVPSQACDPSSFNLTAGSNSGGSQNVRTFVSANGVTAKVTGWSRTSAGVWQQGFVGSYSSYGLGVTDTSEDGSSPSHTVDNVGRLNFLIFEFSQPVVPSSVDLGYVYTDSDISFAIGTLNAPIGTPSDATFAGFYTENNDTTLNTARSVPFNAGSVSGNILVVAASLTDTTPDDYFKVKTLGICVPGCYQPVKVGDFVWNDLDQDGIQDGNEPGISGVKLNLTGTKQSGGSVNLSTTTASNGSYLFSNLEPGTYTVTVDASNFASGGPLAGWTASPTLVGTDRAIDSNPSPTGTSPALLPSGGQDLRLDFGYYFVPPPPPCVESTFSFSGSTSTSGGAGNIRTYTVNGVTVNVSAFSRTTAGAWDAAYLGTYSGGLGVTDGGEGTGGNNTHTVDNNDRLNYVLFEFSQPVVVSKAYLGYVVTDSDLTAWVGNIPGAFANHLNLNDAVLGALAAEQNAGSSSARWASLNGGAVEGNILVIAASVIDSSKNDYFKLAKVTVCVPGNPPVETASIGNFVWKDSNGNGIQDGGEPGVGGATVQLYRCLDNALIATTSTSSSGAYSFTTVPGDYYVKFTLPSGYTFSPANVGNDATDSDANTTTGVAACTTLVAGENDTTWDAGLVLPTPPPTAECVPTTYDFSGSSGMNGTDGNIRTYTVNGISVKVSAFSRDPANGSWAAAWLGAYGGGLGVTDSSEGDGSGDKHTVDNMGRDNYVLFEFSEPVVVNRAYLGYVVTDSDISVWVGNVNNVFNNHQTLSDALLSSFGSPEHNDTTSSSARWAAFNGSEKAGNVLVIAASRSDTTPDDRFKIEKLDICANSEPPCPSPWTGKDIGNCVKSGTESHASGVFTVKGSGADIWNTADGFRYVYQLANGDCSITARVKTVGNSDPWAKAGVMIRETLNANAEHASVFVTPSNGVAFQNRTTTGGTSENINTTGLSAAYWVRIVRSGNTFSAYRSPTGANGSWVLIGSKSISMAKAVYIGLAVTSHNESALCTATFDNVTAVP